jgi:hypothetical protein
MNFINGLPRTPKDTDLICVIVDRLTKVVHFIPVSTTYGGDKLAELYIDNILKLHGVPKSASRLKTHLDYSSTCDPQIDGQTE